MAALITLNADWVTTHFVGMEKRVTIVIPAASIASGTDWIVTTSLFTTGNWSIQQSASTDAPAISADKYADRKVTLALSQADEDCTIYAWGV